MKTKVTIRYQLPPEIDDEQLEAIGGQVRNDLAERGLDPDVVYPLALGMVQVTATISQQQGTGGAPDAIRTTGVLANNAAYQVTGSWPALGSDMIVCVHAEVVDDERVSEVEAQTRKMLSGE